MIRWQKLTRLLNHGGGVEIDKNLVESRVRPIAIERFAGSHE